MGINVQNNLRKFKKQIANVAIMFVQGKTALLRELSVISNKRNEYHHIRELEK
jgi:hypothetical protein